MHRAEEDSDTGGEALKKQKRRGFLTGEFKDLRHSGLPCTHFLYDISFLQEYAEWKKEATDISLPGVYIGLMDRLNSLSRVIVDSTEELCAMLVSSYIEKVKETCKNGENRKDEMRR